MKRILYIVAFLLTVGMGANAQTLIERSDGSFTQGDQYLAALKTLSIPYGVAPTFDGGLARNGSLFFNTTTNKLMIWTGEAWHDVGKDTDLSDYYNKSEVDALIAPFATTADMNAALALKVNTNTTVNGKALSSNITIEQGDIPGLVAALDGKANTSHTHNASDINAGTLNIARIPTGTTGSTVALGNHTHTFAQITNKPTTIAGYGITDAYTKGEVNDGFVPYTGASKTINFNNQRFISGYGIRVDNGHSDIFAVKSMLNPGQKKVIIKIENPAQTGVLMGDYNVHIFRYAGRSYIFNIASYKYNSLFN